MGPLIPDDLIELLADMRGQIHPASKRRWSLRELAAFATEKCGYEVGRGAVQRATAPVRAERAAFAREAAREQIATSLPAQLDTLDEMLTKVSEDFVNAADADDRAAALDAYHKGLALKLRYSGVGERVEMEGAVDITSDGKPIAAMTTDELKAHIAGLRARVEEPDPG